MGQANSQQRLSTYCASMESLPRHFNPTLTELDTKVNIIPLAFVNGIKTPLTNFANAGDRCSLYAGTQLMNCPEIE